MDDGSKLRTAAEFGKLHQVRRLLADGTPLTKDSVSEEFAQKRAVDSVRLFTGYYWLSSVLMSAHDPRKLSVSLVKQFGGGWCFST